MIAVNTRQKSQMEACYWFKCIFYLFSSLYTSIFCFVLFSIYFLVSLHVIHISSILFVRLTLWYNKKCKSIIFICKFIFIHPALCFFILVPLPSSFPAKMLLNYCLQLPHYLNHELFIYFMWLYCRVNNIV